jgi:hypothetical protein
MASNARTSSRGVERADNQGLKTGAKDLERPALRPPLLHSLRLPVFDARVRTTNKLLVYEPRAKFAAAVGINTNIANVDDRPCMSCSLKISKESRPCIALTDYQSYWTSHVNLKFAETRRSQHRFFTGPATLARPKNASFYLARSVKWLTHPSRFLL